MKLLGLSLGELSTAAVYVDKKIIACVSEERFTRNKNDEVFPLQSIEYVLSESGLKGTDIDYVLIAGEKLNLSTHLMRTHSSWRLPDHLEAMHKYWKPTIYENKKINFNELFKNKIDTSQFPGEKKWDDLLNKLTGDYYSDQDQKTYTDFIYKIITDLLGIAKDKIKHIDHHTCHAAYAYWASPIRSPETLVMTIDAYGDGLSSTLSMPTKSGGLKRLHEVPANELTIGRLYRNITLLMGMEPNAHEYKVMGLAPYTKKEIYKKALEVFKNTMYLDGLDFKFKEKPDDHYFWFQKKLEGCRFDGIAGGLQKYTEDILLEYVTNAFKKYKAKHLVYSGGVSMNIKANMLIKDLPFIEQMHVPLSGGDESLAIGVCYAFMDQYNNRNDMEPLSNGYLGPDLDRNGVIKVINKAKDAGLFVYSSSPKKIAKLLANGLVIGRCVGRMEFGARALGNRSIIADPRNRSIVQIINNKIKNRDFWMPFAPSVNEEHFNKYVVNPKNIKSPYMTIGYDSTEMGATALEAGSHPSDKTLRAQTVVREMNPGYHELINAFYDETGVAGLMNTSFNLHGEPIVNSAEDAYRVFLMTDLDAMVIDDTVITKNKENIDI